MKKKLSYRDKLIELAYIYNVKEIQDYVKRRKNLTTGQIELILKKNKIIGIYLCITVFFIPPNIFEEYKGLLFSVTYLSHFAYLSYLISLELFNKWKKSHEL